MASQAILNVKLNRPPTGGTIQVSPITGTALKTKFTIKFLGFSDTDTPITY